jgi:hypothetical protein
MSLKVLYRMGEISDHELRIFMGLAGSHVQIHKTAAGEATRDIPVQSVDHSKPVYLHIRAETADKAVQGSEQVFSVRTTLLFSAPGGGEKVEKVAEATLKGGFGLHIRSAKSNSMLFETISDCSVRILVERLGPEFNPRFPDIRISSSDRCDDPPEHFGGDEVALIFCPPPPR